MASKADDIVDDVDIAPDSDGWDDIEDDVEELSLQCLFCQSTHSNLSAFVKHGISEHQFDLLDVKSKHALDFYGLIKLVNYIRSTVKSGQQPDVTSSSNWNDDVFLQPVLEGDALLFSLDDLASLEGRPTKEPTDTAQATAGPDATIADLKQRLADLQMQFDVYREQVSETLDKRWQENDSVAQQPPPAKDVYDNQYFQGYSSNDIHQIMLQDSVRTDAYRDFIYDNKHLFKDKVVLDVGCGTGILSMFCAKAGAAKVVAVDNSAIIDKARQIAADNNLLDRITFVKRKVEEIDVLPDGLAHVDIIVSEWMGYCLFFEAMLPSVLLARDRFLKRSQDGKTFDGLIVPSHCSLQIAPMADPVWTADNITYWHDVYGFDMSYMLRKAFDEVVVRFPSKDTITGASGNDGDLRVWDLYVTKTEDLQFSSSFAIEVNKPEAIDGWCLWFDMGFSPLSPSRQVSSIREVGRQKGAITFTTGPHGKQTHWQTGVCVIERSDTPEALKQGDKITGTVTYAKGEESRALEIEIEWKSTGAENGKQLWKIR